MGRASMIPVTTISNAELQADRTVKYSPRSRQNMNPHPSPHQERNKKREGERKQGHHNPRTRWSSVLDITKYISPSVLQMGVREESTSII